VFDKLVQVLVFGCGYRKIADAACSATTIRDRRRSAGPLDCGDCPLTNLT
jgi:hypothetical protein